MTSKGRQFMDLIESPEVLLTPGVYDGYSARLVEQAGFRTGAISGAGLSESNLGWADMGIMGFEENLRACRAIAACTDLLLTADADTGYGNALNVHFVVRAFENAGLAGVMIEDQVWPKRCGHIAGKQVIGADEMVQKIKAAANARTDPNFAIKARTDAVAIHGVDEAIRRLNLYAEAGADFVFADALLSAEDIEKVARGVTKPLTVNMGLGIRTRPTTPLLTPRQLRDMGVAGVTYPRLLSTAAVRGMINALAAFEESVENDETVDRPDLTVSFDELNELMGLGRLKDLEERFVTPAGPPGQAAAAPGRQSQAEESQ